MQYNLENYFGEKNIELDRRGRELFSGGLGCTHSEIRDQINFTGWDYGGASNRRTHRQRVAEVADSIAWDIFSTRDRYFALLESAGCLLYAPCARDVIDELLGPFIKPWPGETIGQIRLAWATKFWHFLKPDAFAIADRHVGDFFQIRESDHDRPIDEYYAVLNRVREFMLSHEDWLPRLREVDQGQASYDTKLWDKVFYMAR
ncbi:MAG: hypothetical protein K2Y37_24385 [Pirellulales bacterium]|nr:hypothetical protein [Pirellulales bacterium]